MSTIKTWQEREASDDWVPEDQQTAMQAEIDELRAANIDLVYQFDALREDFKALKRQEPVAEVVVQESGRFHINIYLPMIGEERDFPAGTHQLYAAPVQSGAQPEGYQLVPIEPTKAMVLAAKPWLKHYGLMRATDKENSSVEAYKAMLAAAKEPS